MTQLFKKDPTIDILNKVLGTIGLTEFKEEYNFRKKDLITYGSVEKMKLINKDLLQFYYPCKAKLYLDDIDESKCITIIRQFLRFFEYNLVSREKYNNGEKFIVYSLVSPYNMKSKKEIIIAI
jgi:hypothetical protein